MSSTKGGKLSSTLCRGSSSGRCSIVSVPPIPVSAVGLVKNPVERESEVEEESVAVESVLVVPVVVVSVILVILRLILRCGRRRCSVAAIEAEAIVVIIVAGQVFLIVTINRRKLIVATVQILVVPVVKVFMLISRGRSHVTGVVAVVWLIVITIAKAIKPL
ncbi:hypothetical protein BDV98DRAFT_574486 [Pterulicium gracile]|uniref:Uncharacterized protein n=1 Tax=Pterulicium gracile TaxID=1884261 RepID=A0A5C3Q8F2_9AGAR|nr:hypothetical protein BDV98DRAFT_574486 [Pterula gracilis]